MQTLADRLGSNLVDTRHSETLLLNEQTQRFESQQRQVYRFGFGQSPFPVPEFIVDALRDNAAAKYYAPVQGVWELRRAIADFHNEVDGFEWDPDEVMIGAGSKILLYCLLAAVKSAEVILVSPSWVSYEPQARLAGHSVTRIQTRFEEEWQLTPDDLDATCAALPLKANKFLVLNYPGNPTGGSYRPEQLQALAIVARKHDLIVISDEIYGLLHHSGEHVSLARYYPEACIVTGGLSKWCGAGGWRLGMCHIPSALGELYRQRVLGVASETISSASTPIQLAARTAYENLDAVQKFLSRQRQVLHEVGLRGAEHLRNAGVHVHDPVGGFYLFPDFSPFANALASRGIDTSEEFCRHLMDQTGVALLPGSAFGMPSNSLTARLAYVDFDGGRALGVDEDSSQQLIDGVDHINSWLSRST